MKKMMLALLILSSFFATVTAADQIDSSHSFVTFKVKHLGMANTVGTFREIKGTLDPSAGKIDVTIKAASLDTNDAKRDEHLRGPDFFNVKQFPVLRFTSKKITDKGNNTFEVKGTLLLHGRKKDITLNLVRTGAGKDPWGNQRAGYEASFKLKRSEYGMTYGPEMVGDEVSIYISTETIAK